MQYTSVRGGAHAARHSQRARTRRAPYSDQDRCAHEDGDLVESTEQLATWEEIRTIEPK